jgi:hypothetical protein
VGLNIQADGAHQLEGVRAGDDAGAQAIIEMDFAAFEVILEMYIGRAGA